MTHRIYLRWPEQKVSDKTATESRTVAEFAFEELKRRTDLIGQPVAIAWTAGGKQVQYHCFDASAEQPN